MRVENFDVNVLIDYLKGSSNSPDAGLAALYPEMEWEDLTSEDHEAIDDEIFWCEECGWCCSVDERSERNEDNCDGCG